MRSQRSGLRSTRLSDGKPRVSRKATVAVFAAIMKSWIISFERFASSGRRSASRSPSKTAFDSVVASASAPRSWRRSFIAAAMPSCSRSWRSSSRDAATAAGGAAFPSSHAATESYASLALFRTRARNSEEPATLPSLAAVSATTTARRSSPSLSDVRSVDRRSGSIGNTCAGV